MAGSELNISGEGQQVHQIRESIYGHWQDNISTSSQQLDALQKQWRANNPDKPLPNWWYALEQCAAKLNRIASGRYHHDNFVDINVYLAFVEKLQKEQQKP